MEEGNYWEVQFRDKFLNKTVNTKVAFLALFWEPTLHYSITPLLRFNILAEPAISDLAQRPRF